MKTEQKSPGRTALRLALYISSMLLLLLLPPAVHAGAVSVKTDKYGNMYDENGRYVILTGDTMTFNGGGVYENISSGEWYITPSGIVSKVSSSAGSCTVRGVSPGVAKIEGVITSWAKVKQPYGYIIDSRTISNIFNVRVIEPIITPSIPSRISMDVKTSRTLSVSAADEYSIAVSDIRYSSSDPDIVSVSSSGYLTANKGGDAYITVSSKWSSARCYVHVIAPDPEKVTLDRASAKVGTDESFMLHGTVSPPLALQELTFSSSDTSVAAVDSRGRVTAVGTGKAVIIAESVNGLTASCRVEVLLSPDSITLNKKALTLDVGKSALLRYTIPKNTYSSAIVYSSDNTYAATVSQDGRITAKKPGTAVISVKTANGKQADCTVTVLRPVTGFELDKTDVTAETDVPYVIKPVFTPASATIKTLKWQSSNEAVAEVRDGIVTARSKGTVTITATTYNGLTASCRIEFRKSPGRIQVTPTEKRLAIGESLQLRTSLPAGTFTNSITYSSDNTAAASVSSTGKVYAKKPGTAVIRAKTANGKTAVCTVTVYRPIQKIALNVSGTDAAVGRPVTVRVIFTPSNATDKSIVWSSSDDNIVSVKDGVITAKDRGSAVITATAANGMTATCQVRAYIAVEEIRLDTPSMILNKGDRLPIGYTLLPQYAEGALQWSSSDPAAVKVLSDGTVRALRARTEADVTVRLKNGSVSSVCHVTVNPIPAEKISFASSSVVLNRNNCDENGSLPLKDCGLVPKVLPLDHTDNIVYTSSVPSVAVVRDDRLVVRSLGKTIITARLENGTSASVTVDIKKYAYEENALGITLTDYETGGAEKLGVITVPSQLDGKKVTAVEHLFDADDKPVLYTKINLPDTLLYIGEESFDNQTKLTKITIPAGVGAIDEYAFYGCAALTDIIINTNGSLAVADSAFSMCNALSCVTLGKNVTDVSWDSFSGSKTQWTQIKAASDNPYFTVISGVLFSKDKTRLVRCPIGLEGTYTVPGPVRDIGQGAFYSCINLTAVNLPTGLKSIEDSAFAYCEGLTDIRLPEGLQKIGPSAFGECTKLKSIRLPDSLDGLAEYTFIYCEELEAVTLPEHIKTLGKQCFAHCTSLNGLTLPESITSIGKDAFNACSSLTAIRIPSGVTVLSGGIFYNCRNLTDIELPEGLLSIEDWAFGYCTSLTELSIPDSVAFIGKDTFNNCTALTFVHIPDGVTSLSDGIFYECRSLERAELPAGITVIGEWAFGYCSRLSALTVPSGVTEIGNNAFYACIALTEMTLPESVQIIGKYAFGECSDLKKVILPKKMQSIGERAFTACRYLTEITVPKGITVLPVGVFNGCKGLKKVTLPDTLTKIYTYAFYGCEALEQLSIPDSVERIYSFAFQYCTKLTSVVIPSSMKAIESYVFGNCTALKKVTIPASVTDISDTAFNDCGKFTVYGTAGSAAESFAAQKGLTFVQSSL